jgi:hypothetical protein
MLCTQCSWTAPHNRFVYFEIGGNMESIVYDLRTKSPWKFTEFEYFLSRNSYTQERDNSVVATGVNNYGVAFHLRVALSLYVILKWASEKLEVLKTTASSFQR